MENLIALLNALKEKFFQTREGKIAAERADSVRNKVLEKVPSLDSLKDRDWLSGSNLFILILAGILAVATVMLTYTMFKWILFYILMIVMFLISCGLGSFGAFIGFVACGLMIGNANVHGLPF